MTHRTLMALLIGIVLAACSSSGSGDGASSNQGNGSSANDEAPDGVASGGMAGDGATETNVAPAPCMTNADCPTGVDCVGADADGTGYCDVAETLTGDPAASSSGGGASLGAPAPCNTSADCPEGIACVSFDGSEGPGYCDVNEMEANAGP